MWPRCLSGPFPMKNKAIQNAISALELAEEEIAHAKRMWQFWMDLAAEIEKSHPGAIELASEAIEKRAKEARSTTNG